MGDSHITRGATIACKWLQMSERLQSVDSRQTQVMSCLFFAAARKHLSRAARLCCDSLMCESAGQTRLWCISLFFRLSVLSVIRLSNQWESLSNSAIFTRQANYSPLLLTTRTNLFLINFPLKCGCKSIADSWCHKTHSSCVVPRFGLNENGIFQKT